MDVSVPPIVRGEFVYRDTLFVDVGGEGKRHTRAYESELKDLLNGKAPKDQVAHWYEAQLIQYGLQRSKEKNTAKVRLQQALSQGKLKVPPHIAEMEAQMKKYYASAVRKAKTQSKSGGAKDESSVGAKATKKRKNDEAEDESSKRTKVSVNVGGISINIEQDAQQSSKKKQAASKASTEKTAKGPKGANGNPQDSGVPSNAKAAKQTKEATAKAASQGGSKGAPKAAPAKASTTPSKPTEVKSKATPKQKSEPKVKAEPKAKAEPKVKSESKVKAVPKVKKESKAPTSAKVKKEAGIKDEPMDDFGDDEVPRKLTGVYNIFSQQLSDQFEEAADNLRLTLCVDHHNDKIWGGFDLVHKAGVIKIDGIDAELQMAFGWRARDSDDGGLRFGRGCDGEMELFGHDQVRGTIFNMFPEPVHFAGRRRPGPLWCGRSAESFQEEWNEFVTEAYGR